MCDGIDTVATVLVNDKPIGLAQNMHRQHIFDIPRTLLSAGHNTLRVALVSPLVWAKAQHQAHGREHARGGTDSNAAWCHPGGDDYRVFVRKEVSVRIWIYGSRHVLTSLIVFMGVWFNACLPSTTH